MKRLVLTIMCLVLLYVGQKSATAQVPRCNPTAVYEYMQTLKATGETSKDLAALVKLQQTITAQNIACNGYIFEGKGVGIVKPFTLPKGSYILRFNAAAGSIYITAKVLSGKCADGLNAFTVSMQEDISLETFIDSSGCQVGFEVDYTSMGKQAWTLSLEPLT